MTLLEKAMVRKPRRLNAEPTSEEIELALAWAKEEISYVQAATAMGLSGSAAYSRIAVALRKYIQNGEKL